MFLKRCAAALVPVTAALAVGSSLAWASPPTMHVAGPDVASSSCPVVYQISDLSTGCQTQWAIDPPPHPHFYGPVPR
jgi:hypothetical protein